MFTKPLPFLFLLTLFCGCAEETNSGKTDSIQKTIAQSNDTVRDSVLPPGYKYAPVIVVKDPNAYSQSFLSSLKNLEMYNHYELNDSLLIVDHKDTAVFPLTLPLHQKIHFTGCKDKTCFYLDVERMNYSSLDYHLKITKKDDWNFHGMANLSPSFFLASEIDEDEAGNAYASTEYYSKEPAQPAVTIRIGESEKGTCAKILIQGNLNISLDDSPVLYLKTIPD